MQTRTIQPDHVRALRPRAWQQLRERLLGYFSEMPGLIGTTDEFARLLGTSPQACRDLLERLTAERMLRCTRDGRYTGWAEL